jgi:uncharacterized coiled-coil DUF342 family protein
MILSPRDAARFKQVVKKIETEKAKIAQSRDKLRDYTSEIEAIVCDASEALDDLERATDALSRYL